MANYLEENGVLYLWNKIKALVTSAAAGKVDAVDGKGLSSNDYTSAEKTKLAGIATGANNYTHPSYTSKSLGLYKVTVDATGHVSATSSVAKSDITALGIPSSNTTYSTATSSANGLMSSADKAKLDAFGAASSYALKSDLTNLYKYKGSVATAADLPTTGQATGDVYNIEAASVYGGAGANVAWNGSAWDTLGEIFSISSITNARIDELCV